MAAAKEISKKPKRLRTTFAKPYRFDWSPGSGAARAGQSALFAAIFGARSAPRIRGYAGARRCASGCPTAAPGPGVPPVSAASFQINVDTALVRTAPLNRHLPCETGHEFQSGVAGKALPAALHSAARYGLRVASAARHRFANARPH